jgi:CDP-diacylglycerol--serine O-phosphatidyltransferase
MMWLDEKGFLDERFLRSKWRYLLAALMLFLSWMMVSEVKYPTFKKLDLRATRTFTKTLVAVLFIGAVVILRDKLLTFVLPIFFTAYLIYGFIRPRISRKMRHEIEDEDDEEEEEDETSAPS